jgi:ATP-binding cassette, subfamily B, bacterial
LRQPCLRLGQPEYHLHGPVQLDSRGQFGRELVLDDLLSRVLAELWQLVGETGWQLSHGERSRLYMGRALLQGADLVILDETLTALDPETLHRALRCVLERAPTLLVIAHP